MFIIYKFHKEQNILTDAAFVLMHIYSVTFVLQAFLEPVSVIYTQNFSYALRL